MQRKPGFPTTNCNIKMPDCVPPSEPFQPDDEDQFHRRLQLINFGHTQWGFNNWSWSVNKQELDFVDFSNAKYNVGVVAYVSVTLKTLAIHRENIGYATTVAAQKGLAIHKARKCAVTNALRETLLSFGGSVATDLLEILDTSKESRPPDLHENNQNLANKLHKVAPTPEPKNLNVRSPARKDSIECSRAPHLGPPVAPVPPVRAPPPRYNPNEAPPSLDDMSEDEARAERRRRQKQAQEEFRLKQLGKHAPHHPPGPHGVH